MNMRLVWIFALVCASAALSACDESLSTVAGPTPNLEPTFASIQAEIFESSDSSGRAACTSCHTNLGRNPAGNLNLVHDLAYDQLVNVASRAKPAVMRVLPGDPNASYLMHKVEGSNNIIGNRMPNNGPPYLTDGQIIIMRRWVEIGAPRN
jgi:hypothetical protein